MHRSVHKLLLAVAAVLLLPMCRKHHHETRDYGVVINPIDGISADFIKGADVSMLAQLEASGARFQDEDGTEKDCLQILKEHGVNWVRLRLWNAPVLAHSFEPESGLTVNAGESAAGINDLERDIGLARRAKDLGMKVLLDFHYSDWWADPSKQFAPQAWEGMTLEQLETALHDFTRDAVTRMRAGGAGPDMVQLGNEVTNGMLWGKGAASGWIDKYDPDTYDGFVALLDQGSAAVREVDPAIPIMIHIDAGANNTLYRAFFGTLIDKGVDFDVIGASYYPVWHGSMDDLEKNLRDVAARFQKPVIVAETAYAWTTENADAQPNNWDGTSALVAGPYLPTVQGQTTFLRDVMAVVSGVPDGRGLGIFYWEPDWIAVEGAGWYTQGGDGWDNQTLFDHQGKALPSMNVFRAVSEDRDWVEPQPVSVPAQGGISTKSGTVPTLPPARVLFDDDAMRPMPVTWDEIPASTWTTPGDHALQGTVTDTPLRVTLPVTVSLLDNSGFEDGLAGWSHGPADGTLTTPAENFHGGGHALHWWNAGAVTFHVEQEVVLPAGKTYSFSVWAMGPWNYTVTAYATCDGTALTPTTVTMQGWGSAEYDGISIWNGWVKGSVAGLSGTCTVGVEGTTPGGASSNDGWGNLDDFALTEEP